MIVSPMSGNLHEITALEAAALFEITFPPYTEEFGPRPCSYFKVQNDSQGKFWLSPTEPYDFDCYPARYKGPSVEEE